MNGRRIEKLWVIFAACFSAGACVFAGESISVKQYDITWTFDMLEQACVADGFSSSVCRD